MPDHLTHGWEPETDPSDSLLRSFVEASASRGEYLAAAAGGRAARTPALAMADCESPVWFENSAELLVPPALADRDEAVAAISDFYPRERTALLVSAFPTWDLTTAGFQLLGHPPFMFRPRADDAPPLPSGFEIRTVESAEDLAVFARVLAEGYPMPGGEGAALARLREFDGPLRLFLGYLDGKAVATAGTWLDSGVNQVEWIAALPETRGRGIGAALTYAATIADPNSPAVLIASDLGQPVYERLGYIRLLRMTLWMRPGA